MSDYGRRIEPLDMDAVRESLREMLETADKGAVTIEEWRALSPEEQDALIASGWHP